MAVVFGSPETWGMKVDEFIDSKKPEIVSTPTQQLFGILGKNGMFRGEDLGTREGFKSIEPNINERFNPVTKKPIGYVVSSRITGDSKYFGFENYGTKEDALKAAQAFKKENLKNVLTDDQYLKLRKQNLDKTAREFAGSLDNYVTLKGKKWTRDLVKNKDRQVKIKSPHKYEKLIVDPKIKNEIRNTLKKFSALKND